MPDQGRVSNQSPRYKSKAWGSELLEAYLLDLNFSTEHLVVSSGQLS